MCHAGEGARGGGAARTTPPGGGGRRGPSGGRDERYEPDEDEDEELLLDALDSELALDTLDSELALDRLEDEESGLVGLPLLQPPRAPTPARAAPPDRRIRNSRRSEKRSFRGSDPFFFSFMTPSLCD